MSKLLIISMAQVVVYNKNEKVVQEGVLFQKSSTKMLLIIRHFERVTGSRTDTNLTQLRLVLYCEIGRRLDMSVFHIIMASFGLATNPSEKNLVATCGFLCTVFLVFV